MILTTKSGGRSANEIIVVTLVEKDQGVPRVFELDPQDQHDLVYDPLRLAYPPLQLGETSLRFKNKVELQSVHEGSPIQIGEDEVDCSLLADYIGYLHGHWADPQSQKVRFELTPNQGVWLHVPQDALDYAALSYTVQRYIHNKSRERVSPVQICQDLYRMHQDQGLQWTLTVGQIGVSTISRARCLIIERLQKHPWQEGNHWNNVGTRYGVNEPNPKLELHQLLQPSAPRAPGT